MGTYFETGNITSGNAYEGTSGDIDAQQWNLSGYYSNSLIAYVGSQTPPDDTGHGIYNNTDELYTGFGFGQLDNLQANPTEAVEVANDINTGGTVVVHGFDEYTSGQNVFFQTFWSGSTDGNGRGLYYAYIGTSDVGSSRMLNPTETYSLAQLNVAEYSGLGTCPDVSEVLFGTTGSADSWNANTDLNVITQGGNNDTWVGSSIPTTPVSASPYYLSYWWATYQAFESYGG